MFPRGDILIQPERIPAIEDDLLDDGPLSVCQILDHVGNVPTKRRKKGARSMGDSGADLHQLQYLRLDQIGQIIPRRDHLIEVRIL